MPTYLRFFYLKQLNDAKKVENKNVQDAKSKVNKTKVDRPNITRKM